MSKLITVAVFLESKSSKNRFYGKSTLYGNKDFTEKERILKQI